MDQAIIAAESVQKWFRTGKIEVHALRGVDVAVPLISISRNHRSCSTTRDA